MTKIQFMEMVVRECQVRSQMTYSFSKRRLKSFKRWFITKGKKHFKWSKVFAENQFKNFCKAFNVKIDDN